MVLALAMRLFGRVCISFSVMGVISLHVPPAWGSAFPRTVAGRSRPREHALCLFERRFLPELAWSSVHQRSSVRETPVSSDTDRPASLSAWRLPPPHGEVEAGVGAHLPGHGNAGRNSEWRGGIERVWRLGFWCPVGVRTWQVV